jgi:hypothetical protein
VATPATTQELEKWLPHRAAAARATGTRVNVGQSSRCGAASVVSDGGVAERHLDLTTQSAELRVSRQGVDYEQSRGLAAMVAPAVRTRIEARR